jgi:hypothetical protein
MGGRANPDFLPVILFSQLSDTQVMAFRKSIEGLL